MQNCVYGLILIPQINIYSMFNRDVKISTSKYINRTIGKEYKIWI